MEKEIKSFSQIIKDISGVANSGLKDTFKLMIINQLMHSFIEAKGCEVSVTNLLSLSNLVRVIEVDVVEGVKTDEAGPEAGLSDVK